MMELSIIGEFRALPGSEREVEVAIRKVVAQTRHEPDCLAIHAFRSNRDAALFFVHSRWTDEAAFDAHAALPHTVQFIETVEPLITTHKVEVQRLTLIA
jgi:quinol monooxygenase YgiN